MAGCVYPADSAGTTATGVSAMRTGRRGAAGVLALGLLVVAAPSWAQQPPLRLTPLEVRPAEATTVATVPRALVGVMLPSAAFSAEQADRPLPVSAGRVVDGAAELVVAVDTSGAALDVAARQSAASDLLRAMPPRLRVVVLPGGQVGTPVSALAAVAALQVGPGDIFAGLPQPPAARRLVVLLAACDTLARVPAGLQAADGQLSVLVNVGLCDERAERLAAPGSGLARTGLREASLFAAVDEVVRELLGQYRLRVTGLDPALPLQVTVSSGGNTANGTTTAPAGAAGAVDGEDAGNMAGRARAGDDGLPGAPVLAAGSLLGLAALGLVGLVGAHLLGRRSPGLHQAGVATPRLPPGRNRRFRGR